VTHASLSFIYILTHLQGKKNTEETARSSDDPLFKIALGLDPSVISKPRFLLLHDNDEEREIAFMIAVFLKTIQVQRMTGGRSWVAANTRKDALDLQEKFNHIIPNSAKINMFGHYSPRDLENAPIIISTYQRLLNTCLERNMPGIKSIFFHDFDSRLENLHVKDALLSLLVESSKPTYNLMLSFKEIPSNNELEIPFRVLKILPPSQLHLRKYQYLHHHEFILKRNTKQAMPSSFKRFQDRKNVDFFILATCYRTHRRRREIFQLIENSFHGRERLLHGSKKKTLDRMNQEVQAKLQRLLDANLIQMDWKYFYKTTELGKAIVRHGIPIYHHEKVLAIINIYHDEIKSNLKNLSSWSYYQEFKRELFKCSFGDREYFKSIIDNVYLRIPFELPDREYYMETTLTNRLIRTCKRDILRYIKRKQGHRMASFSELKEKLSFPDHVLDVMEASVKVKKKFKMRKGRRMFTDEIITKSLQELYREKKIRQQSFIALHHEEIFWGTSFPIFTCKECAFFTRDHVCAFWNAIRREDMRRVSDIKNPPHGEWQWKHVNQILLTRSREHYNPRAHACYMFKKIPENARRDPPPRLLQKVLADLQKGPEGKVIKLAASLFSKVRRDKSTNNIHFCPAAAALTLMGHDHLQEKEHNPYYQFREGSSSHAFFDNKKGIERHHLFQRINERMVRKFHKPGKRMSKNNIESKIFELRTDFNWMQFDHLSQEECMEFIDACINYFLDKLEDLREKKIRSKEVLTRAYGGIPSAEEMLLGANFKGRGDLVVRTDKTITIFDLKNVYHPYHDLQLGALGLAAKEKEAGKRSLEKLVILIMEERERDGKLEKYLKEREISFTSKLERNVMAAADQLRDFKVNNVVLANTCKDEYCDKRGACNKDVLKDFMLEITKGYECVTCAEDFEQLECRKKFPTRGLLQCHKCRTSYKHFMDENNIQTVKITPDIDHLLVESAQKLDVMLPEPRVYTRREVKIIYPGDEIDEEKLEKGEFPKLENGEYPSLLHVALIIDKRQVGKQLSKKIKKIVEKRFNTRIEYDPVKKVTIIHDFYDDLISLVRKSEGFLQHLTLANIMSRYTFSRLALEIMGKTDLSLQLECWKILDIYLHAKSTTTQRALLAMEGAAAAIMWDLLKPFFNKHELLMNTRMLERRLLDQYLFSSIKTAARTKGNVLVNFYFKKCEELARFLHAIQLLGWLGTLGLHHGRTRKTALDIMGLVVDLNENFKLLFLLGLLNEIKSKNIVQANVRAWIGRKRMYNYYVGWDSLKAFEKKIIALWNHEINNENELSKNKDEFDWMSKLGLEVSTLRDEYSKQLQEFKESCIFLAMDLGCEGIHHENAISLIEKIDFLDHPTQKLLKIKAVNRGTSFEPFVVKSKNVPFPDENQWAFFHAWSELLRPLHHDMHEFIDAMYDQLAPYSLKKPVTQAIKSTLLEDIKRVVQESPMKFLSRQAEEAFISRLYQGVLKLLGNKNRDDCPRALLALIQKLLHDSKENLSSPIADFQDLLQKEMKKMYDNEDFEDIENVKNNIRELTLNLLNKTRLSFKNERLLQHFTSNLSNSIIELLSVQESLEFEFIEGLLASQINDYKKFISFRQVLA